jgi:hypothetical protein
LGSRTGLSSCARPDAAPGTTSAACWLLPTLVFCSITVVGVIPAKAQTPSQLQFIRHPELPNGRSTLVDGTTDSKGRDFSVGGLSVTQPIFIYLREEKPAGRLRLELSKYARQNVERTCDTTPDKPCVIQTRTDGSMGVHVRAMGREPGGFVLFAYLADDIESDVPSVFQLSQAEVNRLGSDRSSTAPVSIGETTGSLYAYDASTRTVALTGADGAKLDFRVADDTLLIVRGLSTRATDYLRANFNSLPYSPGQVVRISWRMDGNVRTALAIE